MSESDTRTRPKFTFLRNGSLEAPALDWAAGIKEVRQAISEAMSARNVAFLLGAGCSSMVREGKERGISTMAPLAAEFCHNATAARSAERAAPLPRKGEADPASTSTPAWQLSAEEISCLDALGVDFGRGYDRNLEWLMEVLFSQRFVLRQSALGAHRDPLAHVESIVTKVQLFLWTKLTLGDFSRGDDSVIELYETFYKKLVLRDRSLPRPWIFTTNYDVFSEMAMDRLGIPYANGFSGVIERRFNPASFRYALAEQLDLSSRKWVAVDAFVYLCKLHGSVTWSEDGQGLFPIRESFPPAGPGKMLIYPTPAKQSASLGSPYADMFREFQARVVRDQTVLMTAGYAFGDEHVNNIVYQALTIPTFRLIVFADPNSTGEIAKLKALKDPRIWIIGGAGPTEGSKAHYFDTIVEHFMPQRPSERIDEAVRMVLRSMAPREEAEG